MKFLVLYHSPVSARDQMAKATPEQAKAGIDAWTAWAKKAGGAIVDLGTPIGGGQLHAKGSASKSASTIGGYSVLQADSAKALGTVLEGHPHFMMPGGTIEVLEFAAIPGM